MSLAHSQNRFSRAFGDAFMNLIVKQPSFIMQRTLVRCSSNVVVLIVFLHQKTTRLAPFALAKIIVIVFVYLDRAVNLFSVDPLPSCPSIATTAGSEETTIMHREGMKYLYFRVRPGTKKNPPISKLLCLIKV